MIVTLDGSSGLTNAYRSVLSADGSPAISGASRWLDASAPPAAEVAMAKAPARATARDRVDTGSPLVCSVWARSSAGPGWAGRRRVATTAGGLGGGCATACGIGVQPPSGVEQLAAPRRLRSRRSRGPWRAPLRGRRGRSSCCRGRPRSRPRGTGAAGRASRGASALARPAAGVVVAARAGGAPRRRRPRRASWASRLGGPGEREGPRGVAVVGLEQREVQVDGHARWRGRAGSPRAARSKLGLGRFGVAARRLDLAEGDDVLGERDHVRGLLEPLGGLREVALADRRGGPGRPARAGARARARGPARSRAGAAVGSPVQRSRLPSIDSANARFSGAGAGLLGRPWPSAAGRPRGCRGAPGGTTSGRASRGRRRPRTSARRPARLRRTGRARRAHRPRPPWAAVSAGENPTARRPGLGARRRTGGARAGARRGR